MVAKAAGELTFVSKSVPSLLGKTLKLSELLFLLSQTNSRSLFVFLAKEKLLLVLLYLAK